jgi:hypothetical protein
MRRAFSRIEEVVGQPFVADSSVYRNISMIIAIAALLYLFLRLIASDLSCGSIASPPLQGLII